MYKMVISVLLLTKLLRSQFNNNPLNKHNKHNKHNNKNSNNHSHSHSHSHNNLNKPVNSNKLNSLRLNNHNKHSKLNSQYNKNFNYLKILLKSQLKWDFQEIIVNRLLRLLSMIKAELQNIYYLDIFPQYKNSNSNKHNKTSVKEDLYKTILQLSQQIIKCSNS